MIRGIILTALLLLSGQYTPAGSVFTHSALNPCLVSAWAMNEGSGLTLYDTSTGGTNTATINTGASVTWQSNAGLPGTTPLWNGTGYALATSTTLTNFTGTTPFSVTAWVKLSALGTGETFISTLDASGGTFRGWELSKANTADGEGLQFFLINTYSSNTLQVQGNAAMTTGLSYVVATYDGSRTSAGIKLYINGANQSFSAPVNSLSATIASGLPVRFGARNNGSSELTGALAFAEVYNCVLTPTQITTYNAAGPGIY